MKIDVPRGLAAEILSQLASSRDKHREKHGNTVEWDRTPVGQLYSMLHIELNKNSRASVAKSAAVANRRKVKARFTR